MKLRLFIVGLALAALAIACVGWTIQGVRWIVGPRRIRPAVA